MSVTRKTMRRAAIALTCMAAIAACSNAPDRQVTTISIARSIISGTSTPEAPDAAQISRDVAKAMAATDAPMILLTVASRNIVTVMQQLETNRGYTTFGTGDRRSIVLKNGIMTASRGLGNDIMSARLEGVHSLVAARRAGTARREMRYLDGEELTEIDTFLCTVSIGGQERLNVAEIDATVTNVSESCQGDGAAFENTYKVDSAGRILQSRQWHSPMNDYFVIVTLR